MHLTTLPVLVTTLLAGCVAEPGDEQLDEAGGDPTSPADPGVDPASASPDGAEFALSLDGRAVAAAEAAAASAIGSRPAGGTAGLATWYTGTVAAGATQSWHWNNAGTSVYQVGLSPIGASTASPCTFEVTRTWDSQNNSGEREFHFQIKNTGSIACGANILLEGMARINGAWSTGGIDVGASKSWTWNNNSLTGAYFVNIAPSGATASSTCDLEITRTWYVRQPGGEKEFKFTAKNVGDIACQGDILVSWTDNNVSSWQTSTIGVGSTHTGGWNNANPLTRVYVPGLTPSSLVTPCTLEVTRQWYRQVINPTGAAEREFYFDIKNAGSLACTGEVRLNYML
jgi:hypothetical protein